MRGLFSQVGISNPGSAPQPRQGRAPPPHVDGDCSEAMDCFASPKRFGHYGPISDVCALSYEPLNGLIAVASQGGMIKVSGAAGVELVLEEEGSIEGNDPFTHLLFPTHHLLVGVSLTGAVVAWDLTEARRCGNVAPPTGETGGEERVTAVHCPGPLPNAADAFSKERYIFLGLESGRVLVVQVLPLCRASGYAVEPRDVAAGAPEDLLAPGVSGGGLGAVTSIASSVESEELALFGHHHGGIVLWDWIRRKRLALRGLASGGSGAGSERDGEVTCLAFHPNGGAFAAGFAAGCYAVFSNSSAHDSAQPPRRWICEVGDDGSCPREGPTIVRTAVSSMQWVGVHGGDDQKAWGLLVAGGVEMEEGEEPDGVSLLVPSAAPVAGGASANHSKGGGRPRAKDKNRASSSSSAVASLETAVFVPFAMGQERLSHVHAVIMGGGGIGSSGQSSGRGLVEKSSESSDGFALSDRQDHRADREKGGTSQAAAEQETPEESVVVLGLVTWNEEVRAADGRLSFRRASSVQACPVQTSPFAALLQLAPGRIDGHLSGFASVTAVASTPLLSSSIILDFATGLGAASNAGVGSGPLSKLLRGGGLRWADGVPARARDEALGTSEMLIAGHSDGRVTLWECCGPAPRQDGISISSGRVQTLEIPSGAAFLGTLTVSELKGDLDLDEDGDVPVTALDAWVERDHVAEAERNACWVAVGFASGEASVFVLSSRMDADGNDEEAGCAGACEGEIKTVGLTPLAARPVEVSEVQLSESAMGDDSEREGPWKKFLRGRDGREGEGEAEVEDLELEAAIAKARADARAIEESGELNEVGGFALANKFIACEGEQRGGAGEEQEDKEEEAPETERREEEDGRGDEKKILRQELSEAMADEGAWVAASLLPPPQPVVVGAPESENYEGEERGEKSKIETVARKASLVQLALRLHSHPVRCVALSFDTVGSALTLIAADAEGVVSVTDVSTGSASLLPMRAPRVRPCLPSIAIGPLPGALLGGLATQRGRQAGAAGALFVLLDGWLNVFDLASRDPVDVAQVPGFARKSCSDSGGGGNRNGVDTAPARTAVGASRDVPERTWLFCVDEHGLPLGPYASEPLSLFDPKPPHAGVGAADIGSDGLEGNADAENDDLISAATRTIWVTPPSSSTALDSHHEYELQAMSDAPTPRSFLLAVRGDVAVVVATEEGQGSALPFSRRGPIDGREVAAFKGRSGAELVVKARLELPAAAGRVRLPRVDGAGVCMVPAGGGGEGGKAGSRGCLVATDTSGFVTALLLPSLSPVFRDRLPVQSGGGGFQPGATGMSQKSVCNLVGELTVQGAAGELTRWSLLTDEAYSRLMISKPRLIKVSKLATPTLSVERPLAGQPGDGAAEGEHRVPHPRGRSSRGVLGRFSLGGSKKSIADVFAIEPSLGSTFRRQSSGESAHSASSGSSASIRRGRGSGVVEEEATTQRQALFGERESVGGRAAGATSATGRAAGGVGGAYEALGEARDLAIERGEKLASMVDTSRQLEDSAMAFGDMARQLRRQQEKEEECCVS